MKGILVVYADAPHDRSVIREACLPLGVSVLQAPTVADFVQLLATADAGIISMARPLDGNEAAEGAAVAPVAWFTTGRLSGGESHWRTVLSSARDLERWIEGILRMHGQDSLIAFLRKFRLPVTLRRALVTAVSADPPYPSVGALAAAVRKDRRYLSHLWKSSRINTATYRLEDFIDLLQMLAVCRLIEAGVPKIDACFQAAISPSALKRRKSALMAVSPDSARPWNSRFVFNELCRVLTVSFHVEVADSPKTE